MKCFVPTLTLGVSLPKQEDWEDKFGGLPWGLPLDQWPICQECDAPLSFLAQFRHHHERLDLGKENRALYLFQCEEGGCASFVMDGGANAVLILDQDQLSFECTKPPDEETYILPELRVTQWEEQEDGHKIETKLNGIPDWIQGEENPEAPYYFAGQIDCYLPCTKNFPDQDGIIKKVEVNGYHSLWVKPEIGEPFWVSIKDGYHCAFANFGDMGMGYLFVDPDPTKPTGKFLWQCH